MNIQRYLDKLTRLKETLLVTGLGWIPLAPGKAIRRFCYRTILQGIGSATRIETRVIFANANRIRLGRAVRIDQDVRLRNMDRSGEIWIGDRVALARGVDIKVHSGGQGRIEIGDYAALSPYCCLSGRSIKIGKHCLLAHNVGVFANNHVFADPDRPIREQGHTFQGVVIEDDCWLGTGVKVLDGVTIGRGCVVGAGAVVTRDLPPYSIAVGVPAKVVAQRDRPQSPAAMDEARLPDSRFAYR